MMMWDDTEMLLSFPVCVCAADEIWIVNEQETKWMFSAVCVVLGLFIYLFIHLVMVDISESQRIW